MWATLLNCALAILLSIRRGLKKHWGVAVQHCLLAALALLAFHQQSENGLFAVFLAMLLVNLGGRYVRTRATELVKSGRTDEAKRWCGFSRVLIWGPHGQGWRRSIDLSCRYQEGDKSVADLVDAESNWRAGTMAEVDRLVALRAERRWAEAASSYERLRDTPGLPGHLHVLGAHSLLRDERFEEAASAMQAAVESPGRGSQAFVQQAAVMCACLLGSWRACEFWTTLTPAFRWEPGLQLHARGLALSRAGSVSEAEQAFADAMSQASPEYRATIEPDAAAINRQWQIPAEAARSILTSFRELYVANMLADQRLGQLGTLLLCATLGSYLVQPRDFWETAFVSRATLAQGEWWRLAGHMFTHFNWAHVIINCLGLSYTFGLVASLFGRRSLLLYFAAGAFAAGAQMVAQPSAILMGASGGVFGLYGACAAVLLRLKLVPMTKRRRQLRVILLCVGLQTGVDQLVPRVAGVAHLAGFGAGFALAMVLPWSRRTPAGRVVLFPEQTVYTGRGPAAKS